MRQGWNAYVLTAQLGDSTVPLSPLSGWEAEIQGKPRQGREQRPPMVYVYLWYISHHFLLHHIAKASKWLHGMGSSSLD